MTMIANRKQKNVFERNPRKTIAIIVIIFFLITDFIAARMFLLRNESDNEDFRIFHCYYHHTLRPNSKVFYTWGYAKVNLITNSFGFKDKTARKINSSKSKYRILFMGDSFTEGIGIVFDSTFVGILEHHYPEVEILNAAVSGYSPRLYYLKTKFLIEEAHIQLDQLFVFIDISDMRDEIAYQDFTPRKRFINIQNNIISYLKFNSLTGNQLIYPFLMQYFYHPNSLDRISGEKFWDKKYIAVKENFFREKAGWTYNTETYNKWGKKGAELAIQNMEKLNDLCKKNKIKLTVAVYPWPDQIFHDDLESRQVSIWKEFTDKHHIDFINYFPDFISEKDTGVIKKYFIEGDVHWNEKGHRKVAEKILLGNFINAHN